MRKAQGCGRRAAALLAVSLSLLALPACDRATDIADRIAGMMRGGGARGGRRSPLVSDHERIARKFGAPQEKIGVGKAPHSENGIRYDRKWNYYYAGRAGSKPVMRTGYFLNERYAGSVVHQPDGKITRETVRFSY